MKKLLILAAMLGASGAQAFGDPDWPCEARKVVNLSIGQMWPLATPENLDGWRDDPRIADAVQRISARRTDMVEVGRLIDGVAETEPRDERLASLFAGVFATVNAERARIVDGVVRYSLRQRALSEKIDAERVDLARLEAETAADDFDALDLIEERQDALLWDTRIYDERRQSLIYVCETPVILEKRLFEVSRMIQERMSGG